HDSLPSLEYLSSPDGTVRDPNGDPLYRFFPPFDADTYPLTNRTAPQKPWVAICPGRVTFESKLSDDWRFRHEDEKSGELAFTVKRARRLLGKKILEVEFGQPDSGRIGPFDVTPGDSFYVDVSGRDVANIGGVNVVADFKPAIFFCSEGEE